MVSRTNWNYQSIDDIPAPFKKNYFYKENIPQSDEKSVENPDKTVETTNYTEKLFSSQDSLLLILLLMLLFKEL